MSVLQRLFACIRRKQAATLPDTPNISENKIRKVEYCSEECGIAVNFVCQGTAGEAGNVFKKYCSKIWGMHPLANETTDDQRHYIWLGESEGSSHSRIICDLVQQKGVLRVGLQDAGLDFYHRTPATEGESLPVNVGHWPEDRHRPRLDKAMCAIQVFKNGDVESKIYVEGRFDEPDAVWLRYMRKNDASFKHTTVPPEHMTYGPSEDGLGSVLKTVEGARLFVDREPLAILLFWKHPDVEWGRICLTKEFQNFPG